MPLWVPIASLLMGVLAYSASAMVARVLRRWKAPARFDEWQDELVVMTHELCEAHLHVAGLQAALLQRLGELPADFQAPVFKAVHLGQAVERAVLAEALRRGLVPPDMGVALVPVAEPAQNAPAPAPGAPDSGERAPAAPGGMRWEGLRLVPARRSGAAGAG